MTIPGLSCIYLSLCLAGRSHSWSTNPIYSTLARRGWTSTQHLEDHTSSQRHTSAPTHRFCSPASDSRTCRRPPASMHGFALDVRYGVISLWVFVVYVRPRTPA
ncbi:hypothetical protein C8Q73DRAFT_673672 [Cubamyces lactineus]|nr:hypothetical protein C8Q73DRAFT_673672 [Cubamyces lactineus]